MAAVRASRYPTVPYMGTYDGLLGHPPAHILDVGLKFHGSDNVPNDAVRGASLRSVLCWLVQEMRIWLLSVLSVVLLLYKSGLVETAAQHSLQLDFNRQFGRSLLCCEYASQSISSTA